jgi:hypothetical protein
MELLGGTHSTRCTLLKRLMQQSANPSQYRLIGRFFCWQTNPMSLNGNDWIDDHFIPRLVDVNHIQCAIAAQAIPELARMREATDPFSLKEKSKEAQATALFYLVGICNRLNWDFVLGQFASELWELTEGFSPDVLETIDRTGFKRHLELTAEVMVA